MIGLMPAGCNSDQRAAAYVTQQFLDAGKRGDETAVKATLTAKAQEKWSTMIGSSVTKQNQNAEYTVGDPVITDDIAVVPVQVKAKDQQQEIKVKLRKEEGQWRVYAMLIPANGIELTLDFENPEEMAGEMFKALGQGMGEMFKAMGKGMGEGMGAMMKGMSDGMKGSTSGSTP